MRILCTSDLHGDIEALRKICDKMGDFDAAVIAGDITNFNSARVALHIVGEIESEAKNLFVVPGNCDLPEVSDVFDNVGISLHGCGIILNEVGFFGVGGSNKTPFNTPLEFSEADIGTALEAGYSMVNGSKVRVLVSHTPPFDTVDKTSSGDTVGSKSVREFIDNNDVELVICGHVHECRGSVTAGGTQVINTGPTAAGYVEVTIEDNKKISHKFKTYKSIASNGF